METAASLLLHCLEENQIFMELSSVCSEDHAGQSLLDLLNLACFTSWANE